MPAVASRSAGPDPATLAALDEAARAITGLLEIEDVLQLIVDRVRSLVDAQYAALGIVGPDGHIARFITAGIGPEVRKAIGPPPHGRGLLGLIIREGRSYRIPTIANHPDSSGFPPNHPPMTSFLGVPVPSNGMPIGNLYLTDKRGAAGFSESDQQVVELFARHAAIAIDNARLHAQVGRLAVTEERDRIGRDLHDGIIQSLYAVSLSLEDVPELMADARPEAERRVDAAIDQLHLAIRDIRNFIYGLRPEAVDGTEVVAGIAALAHDFRDGGLVDVVASLDQSADPGLSPDDGVELLWLVREALSNAVRHAHAHRVDIRLGPGDAGPALEISDDGVGFEAARDPGEGHNGLKNMRVRAEAIGAGLTISSAPGAGTRIRVEFARGTS
jgi:signal transduction histidine kinase